MGAPIQKPGAGRRISLSPPPVSAPAQEKGLKEKGIQKGGEEETVITTPIIYARDGSDNGGRGDA